MDTAALSALSAFSIPPQNLASAIGTPDAPLILDVRHQARFAESACMLAAAQRCAPEDVERFAKAGPPGKVVVYCVHGHKVSEDAVRVLRAAGWDAGFLAGGFEGGEDGVDLPQHITNWRAGKLPVIRKRPDFGVTGEQPSRWITRERPKIDRIACPWLVRRFVDRRAEFLYVASELVLVEAVRLHAVAYDIPGAPISHEGELCSFDTLLRAFGLEGDAALAVLARIVRGADTDRLDLSPESAGLLAFSLGLSHLHSTNDLAMLDAAMPLYDALYAWCRNKVRGRNESHNWKPQTMTGVKA